MDLQEKLVQDMKAAMKSKDKTALETIRMLRSQIKNTGIATGKKLDDADVLAVLAKEAKKRKESLELYKKGGREDLVEKESQELKIVESYLPEAMSAEELKQIVSEVIEATGAQSMSDMGKIMGQVMPRTKGRADGKAVQNLVRELLS